MRAKGTNRSADLLIQWNDQETHHILTTGAEMASSQQSNRLKQPDDNTEQTSRFDQETRDKSQDALMSLLTHLKRQDDQAKSD